MTPDLVLDALGDPTRRAVFTALRAGPLPVGVLAERLPVSRPAVSQHLRVLKEAGLVTETAIGTRRLYRVDPAGLRAVHTWLDAFWNDTLDAFVELTHDRAAENAVDEAESLLQPPEPPGSPS